MKSWLLVFVLVMSDGSELFTTMSGVAGLFETKRQCDIAMESVDTSFLQNSAAFEHLHKKCVNLK